MTTASDLKLKEKKDCFKLVRSRQNTKETNAFKYKFSKQEMNVRFLPLTLQFSLTAYEIYFKSNVLTYRNLLKEMKQSNVF